MVVFLNLRKNMVEQEYLIVMDFLSKSIRIIELTREEEYESLQYEDFGEFVETIQEKYGFDLDNSEWMLTETPGHELKTFVFKNGEDVSKGKLDDIIFKMY